MSIIDRTTVNLKDIFTMSVLAAAEHEVLQIVGYMYKLSVA